MLRLEIVIAMVAMGCGGAGGGAGLGEDAAGSPDAPVVRGDGASSVSCAGKTAQPLDAVWMVPVGGTMRTARVHVPASYDPATPTPVVLDLHGRTSNATQQAWLSHMNAKSDAAGFIAVHPESSTSPTSWNSGGGCCDPAYSQGVDDVGFMEALYAELQAKLCMDPDRVFAAGLSNGGYLAHTLGCEMSDRIAAVGAVAGLLQLETCHATRPVPVFQIHGTEDTLVRYSWVDSTIDFWKQHNGCTSSATTFHNGDATCVAQQGCTADASVVLCTITGGGHQWPGGEAIPLLGYKSNDLVATDALWDFFVAHPRPAGN